MRSNISLLIELVGGVVAARLHQAIQDLVHHVGQRVHSPQLVVRLDHSTVRRVSARACAKSGWRRASVFIVLHAKDRRQVVLRRSIGRISLPAAFRFSEGHVFQVQRRKRRACAAYFILRQLRLSLAHGLALAFRAVRGSLLRVHSVSVSLLESAKLDFHVRLIRVPIQRRHQPVARALVAVFLTIPYAACRSFPMSYRPRTRH